MKKHSLALAIPTSTPSGRSMLAGVLRHLAAFPEYQLLADGVSGLPRVPADLSRIAGSVVWQEMALTGSRYRALSSPVVGLGHFQDSAWPSVFPDGVAAGKMAAAELLGGGCGSFLYLSPEASSGSDSLWRGFSQTLRNLGRHLERQQVDESVVAAGKVKALESLLEQMPSEGMKLGVFCRSDAMARGVLKMCLEQGIDVPGQVQVVGYGNDPLFCDGGLPALSSIDPGWFRLGEEAARMLMQLVRREDLSARASSIEPEAVVRRGSTMPDTGKEVVPSKVTLALSYMERNLQLPIDIANVADHLGMTRRSLELHFHKSGRFSPARELARIRIGKAMELLAHSTMTAKEVAFVCGFHDIKRLFRTFRREVGMTPLHYRRQQKGAPH